MTMDIEACYHASSHAQTCTFELNKLRIFMRQHGQDATFVACPDCGIVLKDRNGMRGVRDEHMIWQGRVDRKVPIEYTYMRSGVLRSRNTHADKADWEPVADDVAANVMEYLQLLIRGDRRCD
jgi:hypothetical protein